MMAVEVAHRFVTANGLRFHYVECGTGPTVLLLHGFPENWWTWRCQLQPLAAAGYRVIAPDLRGYGGTQRSGPYDVDTLSEDLRGLITALGGPVHLVGHDWGGGLAWHFATHHPSFIRKLVILNAPHPAPLQRALRGGDLAQMWRSWYMFFFLVPWLPECLLTANDAAWPRHFYAHVHGEHFSREELAPIFAPLREPGAAKAAIDYYRAALHRGLRQGRAFQDQGRIEAPTLVIWGMRDKSLRYQSLVPPLSALVPDLRIDRVEDAAHFVHCEKPDHVNAQLISFFAEGNALNAVGG